MLGDAGAVGSLSGKTVASIRDSSYCTQQRWEEESSKSFAIGHKDTGSGVCSDDASLCLSPCLP